MIYASVKYRHDCGTIITAKFAAKDIDTMLEFVDKEIRADDRVSEVLEIFTYEVSDGILSLPEDYEL